MKNKIVNKISSYAKVSKFIMSYKEDFLNEFLISCFFIRFGAIVK